MNGFLAIFSEDKIALINIEILPAMHVFGFQIEVSILRYLRSVHLSSSKLLFWLCKHLTNRAY